jgi:hypothetical protein
MDESLSFLSSHLRVCITEDESNGSEEVALPGAIATNNDIELGREWIDDGLVLIAALTVNYCFAVALSDIPFEALNSYLLDMHGCASAPRPSARYQLEIACIGIVVDYKYHTGSAVAAQISTCILRIAN